MLLVVEIEREENKMTWDWGIDDDLVAWERVKTVEQERVLEIGTVLDWVENFKNPRRSRWLRT